jgi:AmmeMemoRadiSam system protein A
MGPKAPPPVTASEGALLATIAAAAVRTRLTGQVSRRPVAEHDPEPAPDPKALREPGVSFVTLQRRSRLRGCVGSLRATRPLYLDVVRNARKAMADPRLRPVDRTDWPELDVKVSVLTPPTPLHASGRDGLLAALRPGVDGLVLADGVRRATFLPAVWQRLPEPARFVAALLTKGGWPDDGWPENLTVHRYQAYEFCDPAPRDPLTD